MALTYDSVRTHEIAGKILELIHKNAQSADEAVDAAAIALVAAHAALAIYEEQTFSVALSNFEKVVDKYDGIYASILEKRGELKTILLAQLGEKFGTAKR